MLEHYEKKEQEQEDPIKVEPTLKDILSKNEDSFLFGEMMKKEGQEHLSSKIAKGELSEFDIQNLDKYRTDFIEISEKVKVIKESISNDTINAYTKNNPELQKVVGLIGIESYTKLIKEKLASVAIQNPDFLDKLSSSVNRKNSLKIEIYDGLDKEITELCKKKNIKPEEYMNALALKDETEREKELRKTVRNGYNWFQKTGDWLSKGEWSKKRVDLLSSKKEDVDFVMGKMKLHQGELGGLLAGMVGNKDVMDTLSKQLIGENTQDNSKQGFKESKGLLPKEIDLQNKWGDHKKQIKGGWDKLTPDQQDLEKEAFLKQQDEMFKKENKQGFWGVIFGAIYDSFIKDNKDKLK